MERPENFSDPRTAVLQVPSKSYENRRKRSAFVQLSRNRLKEDWYSPCQEGTHAMKSVKPSVDILEGLLTGVNMDASAPHLIHKWFTGHSRPCACF